MYNLDIFWPVYHDRLFSPFGDLVTLDKNHDEQLLELQWSYIGPSKLIAGFETAFKK